MKQRPILFNSEMVCATIDGRKTHTRRIINPQPTLSDSSGFNWKGRAYGLGASPSETERNFSKWSCKHGKVGDRLWVRETFQPVFADGFDHNSVARSDYKTGRGYKCSYPATDGIQEFIDAEDNVTDRCTPSIHMPRWASRITLEITGVRAERLQDISEADAKAEGIQKAWQYADCYYTPSGDYASARVAFQRLWESINGPESWDANPFVWVIEFKRVEG